MQTPSKGIVQKQQFGELQQSHFYLHFEEDFNFKFSSMAAWWKSVLWEQRSISSDTHISLSTDLEEYHHFFHLWPWGFSVLKKKPQKISNIIVNYLESQASLTYWDLIYGFIRWKKISVSAMAYCFRHLFLTIVSNRSFLNKENDPCNYVFSRNKQLLLRKPLREAFKMTDFSEFQNAFLCVFKDSLT